MSDKIKNNNCADFPVVHSDTMIVVPFNGENITIAKIGEDSLQLVNAADLSADYMTPNVAQIMQRRARDMHELYCHLSGVPFPEIEELPPTETGGSSFFDENPQYWPVGKIAEILRVSAATVRRKIEAGEFGEEISEENSDGSWLKVGRSHAVLVTAVKNYFQSEKEKQQAELKAQAEREAELLSVLDMLE